MAKVLEAPGNSERLCLERPHSGLLADNDPFSSDSRSDTFTRLAMLTISSNLTQFIALNGLAEFDYFRVDSNNNPVRRQTRVSLETDKIFSPGFDRVAASTQNYPAFELYTITLDGLDINQISENELDEYMVDW